MAQPSDPKKLFPGTLTSSAYGFSMPVDAPLYGKPPYEYRDATILIFNYVTDLESVRAIVPTDVMIPETPEAALVFANYPWTSIGAYNEAVVYLNVFYHDKPYKYGVALYVTTDVAMAAGREMAGVPKKIGKVDIKYEAFYTATLERPAGLPLASLTLRPERKLPVPFPQVLDYLTLRVIPSPSRSSPPSLCEFVSTKWQFDLGEIWTGTASGLLTGSSALDPLHKVPIVAPLPCEFIKGHMIIDCNP